MKDQLTDWPTLPGLIDLVLVFTVLEGIGLALWRRRTGRGPSLGSIGRMLLPGLCLMVALRVTVAGQAWPFVPLALTAALAAHIVDLHGRWRGWPACKSSDIINNTNRPKR